MKLIEALIWGILVACVAMVLMGAVTEFNHAFGG